MLESYRGPNGNVPNGGTSYAPHQVGKTFFFSFKLLIGWGIEMLMSSFMVLRYNWIQRKNCGLLVSYMLHQSLEKGRKAKMGLAS